MGYSRRVDSTRRLLVQGPAVHVQPAVGRRDAVGHPRRRRRAACRVGQVRPGERGGVEHVEVAEAHCRQHRSDQPPMLVSNKDRAGDRLLCKFLLPNMLRWESRSL